MKRLKLILTVLSSLTVNNFVILNQVQSTQKIDSVKYQVDLKIPLFLGNEYRRYYGKGPVPKKIKILWKKYIGSGDTKVWNKVKKYTGTGWPGQPVLTEENGRLYILFGSFDYNLRKLDALTGKTIWKHKFNNIIKGTPTLYIDPYTESFEEKYVVFCGSRRGPVENASPDKNYRAISLLTGRELWSFVVPHTSSYSRDAEGNGLIVDNILYFAAENGVLYIINPDLTKAKIKYGIIQPEVKRELVLYNWDDIRGHKKNLVVESSPSKLGDMLFITAGSGYVYGIDIKSLRKEWNFYIGSDLDASPVITKDGFLLVGVEKQYIEGKGGVFKLNTGKTNEESAVWYFPTDNMKVGDWEGGVIGSVGINDEYNPIDEKPSLLAIGALDGYLYIVSQDELSSEKTVGPDGLRVYSKPKLVCRKKIGSTISTPIFIDNYLIAGGHAGILHIFKINYKELKENIVNNEALVFKSKTGKKWKVSIREVDKIALKGSIESTPIVWEKKIFIGDKSGYFYCIGGK